MDSGVKDANGVTNCNGNNPYAVEESREEAEEDGGESKSLLPPPASDGGIANKKQPRQRSSRRRVQWNDRNGNKLVEVLEYQPSDSSDSEDESSSGDWTWEYAIASCIHICCCQHGPKVELMKQSNTKDHSLSR